MLFLSHPVIAGELKATAPGTQWGGNPLKPYSRSLPDW